MTGNLAFAAHFLVNALCGLYLAALELRFVMGVVRTDFGNPLASLVVAVTNPALWPLRRVIPPWRRTDVAALVLMFAVAGLNVAFDLWLMDQPLAQPGLLAGYSLLRLAVVLVNLYTFTVIVAALMSWFSPGASPVARALAEINRPVLAPFRRLIGPVGGVDLSPLFACLLLQLAAALVPLPAWFR